MYERFSLNSSSRRGATQATASVLASMGSMATPVAPLDRSQSTRVGWSAPLAAYARAQKRYMDVSSSVCFCGAFWCAGFLFGLRALALHDMLRGVHDGVLLSVQLMRPVAASVEVSTLSNQVMSRRHNASALAIRCAHSCGSFDQFFSQKLG